MGKKKRAPLTELRKVKNFADERLIEKKIILPHDQSAIQRIFNSKEELILPGLPAYLPRPPIIHTTRRVLYDLAREWQLHTQEDVKLQNNVSEFFRFVIKGLEEQNSKVKSLMLESVLKQDYDFKLFQRKSIVTGIARFLVDSFAVSVIEKANSDVAEYIEWFYMWTESLLGQWGENTQLVGSKDEFKTKDNTITSSS